MHYNAEMNDIKADAVAEGITIGKAKEKLDLAKNLLDILTDEQIAEKTELDIQTIKELRAKNN